MDNNIFLLSLLYFSVMLNKPNSVYDILITCHFSLKTHVLQFRVQMFQSWYTAWCANWTGTNEFFSGSHPRTRRRHGSEKLFLFRIFIV